MNKDDVKKIKNRIEQLSLEFEKNRLNITELIAENGRIQGAVTELTTLLDNLSPEKKETKSKDGNP